MVKIKLSSIFTSFLLIFKLEADDNLYPTFAYQLDNFFAHHLLVAEKSTHQLHLFENKSGRPQLVKSYLMATGKYTGNKSSQGDLKTPEGLYKISDFFSSEKLLNKYGNEGKIYGAGAFVLNYPNNYDQIFGKTGSGIWLHSTDDDSRVAKGLDSKGCVVIQNNDIKDVSQYIEIDITPFIIVQDLTLLPQKTWELNKNSILETMNKWKSAWQGKKFDDYISFYDNKLFKDSVRGNYSQFKNYKKSIFSLPGTPRIEFSNINVLSFKDYTVINFIQSYKSNTIDDAGKKTLYLKLDENYNWKIISEVFEKLGQKPNNEMAFTPQMRYFKKTN
ncbi:MAG: L,D-transpeptidase family protein [Bacteriovoracaceae bacterium]